jgi:hypothetical protein
VSIGGVSFFSFLSSPPLNGEEERKEKEEEEIFGNGGLFLFLVR